MTKEERRLWDSAVIAALGHTFALQAAMNTADEFITMRRVLAAADEPAPAPQKAAK